MRELSTILPPEEASKYTFVSNATALLDDTSFESLWRAEASENEQQNGSATSEVWTYELGADECLGDRARWARTVKLANADAAVNEEVLLVKKGSGKRMERKDVKALEDEAKRIVEKYNEQK